MLWCAASSRAVVGTAAISSAPTTTRIQVLIVPVCAAPTVRRARTAVYARDMPRTYATADRVGRDVLLEFIRPRHHATLVTRKRDGSPQMSPVTCGVDADGHIVVSTYPQRAKAVNARRDPAVSVLVHSDTWDGPYVQVDGTAEVIDMPEAVEPLVEYFRCISGEHPDWDEYRDAMRKQNKSLLRITIDRWGPVATGGFPPDQAES